MRHFLTAAVALAVISVAGLAQASQQPAKPIPNQFKTEDEAKAHCPGDQVVWATAGHKVYRLPGDKYYGKTKRGAYMCQADANASHLRAAKVKKPKA